MTPENEDATTTIAKLYAGSRLKDIVDNVRDGWNGFNFIFYIGGIGALLGAYFGLSGAVTVVLGIAFFYHVGKFHNSTKAIIKTSTVPPSPPPPR
jgi:hypothetical protein